MKATILGLGVIVAVGCSSSNGAQSCGSGTHAVGKQCVADTSHGGASNGGGAEGGVLPGKDASTPPPDAGAESGAPIGITHHYPSIGRWLVYSNGSKILAADVSSLPPASPVTIGGVSGFEVVAAKWSPDGSFLAVLDGIGVVDLLDFRGGTPVGSVLLKTLAAGSRDIAWSPDGTRLAVNMGGVLSLYDPTEPAPIPVDVDHGAWLFAWSPSGKYLAYALWDDATGVGQTKLSTITAGVPGAATTLAPLSSRPDLQWASGRDLLAFTVDAALDVLDPTTNTPVELFTGSGPISALSWGPEDGAISFNRPESAARVDGVVPGSVVTTAGGFLTDGHSPDQTGQTRSPNGAWNSGVAPSYAYYSGTAGQALDPVVMSQIDSGAHVTWSPDETWFAVGDRGQHGGFLVRVATGVQYLTFTLETTPQLFSPDSKVLAAGATLIDLTGPEPGTPVSLGGAVAAAALASAWSPGSDKFAYETASQGLMVVHVDGTSASQPIRVDSTGSPTAGTRLLLTWQP